MLPDPLFDTPPEPLLSADESACDPNAHRPGVLAFRDFVLEHQGGSSAGTARPCVPGSKSGHYSARAWDWVMDASDPADRALVDELLDWLTANDAELFRRAGLSYMIWDKRSWSAFKPFWHPYDGYNEEGKCTMAACRDAHTSHVHFSFNWPGAEGDTSFYRWLSLGQPTKPLPLPPKPVPVQAMDLAAKIFPLLAGAIVGFAGLRHVKRQWRRRARV